MATDDIPQAPSIHRDHVRTYVEAVLIMATPSEADGPIAKEALSAVARFCVLAGCPRAQFLLQAEMLFDAEEDRAVAAGEIEPAASLRKKKRKRKAPAPSGGEEVGR